VGFRLFQLFYLVTGWEIEKNLQQLWTLFSNFSQIPAMMVFSTNPGPSAHFFDIPGQMVDSEDIREIV
jgi:hypothetical protein